jgi:hypothetical protein
MRLYRFEGADPERPVSSWVSDTDEYRNMKAAAGRWFADTIDEALWYRCDHEAGHLVCVDVDDDLAEQFRVSNLPLLPGGRSVPDNPAAWSLRPEFEFFLPGDLARLAHCGVPDCIPETEEAALRL